MYRKKPVISKKYVANYIDYLREQERSKTTLKKYQHDLNALILFLDGKELTKAELIHWKESLISQYAAASVNAMLAALNGYLRYMGWVEMIVFLPEGLRKLLRKYIRSQKKTTGAVFTTRTGKTLDRSNIWRDMKKPCAYAGVSQKKVFPHNLRHLFARVFYSVEKDLSRLADILGHTNLSTTRIYTAESGFIHARQMERLKLIVT